MSTIVITDLCPDGFEILVSDESYLDTLTEPELNIYGGLITSPQRERELSLTPTALSFLAQLL